MTRVKEDLLAFLKDWLAWAKGGASEVSYRNDRGLCQSALDFAKQNNWTWGRQAQLNALLSKGFAARAKGMPYEGVLYPFGGYAAYSSETRNSTTHLNAERLAWVQNTIKELEPCLKRKNTC